MIYFASAAVVLLATLLGSLAGIGGGVIIKPCFDLIGVFDAQTISFLSSFAVFAMALSVMLRQSASKQRSKADFDKGILINLCLTSAIGGWTGKALFDLAISSYSAGRVKMVQNLILALLMLIVAINTIHPFAALKIKSPAVVAVIGLFLGLSASFLSIGGGPINMAFLLFFFSMSVKKAAFCSLAIILFSQGTKLAVLFAENQFKEFDLSLLLIIVPCAIIGGLIGTQLKNKLSEKMVKTIFVCCIGGVSLLSFYNAFWG